MLPVLSYRDKIAHSVLDNKVTIITAETGSGKSTKIPQILSPYFEQIIVTEPRRMAAKTLAIRVSQEMQTTLGEEVGYRTAYDRCASSESKIVYCTDGLQLVRSLLGSDDTRSTLLILDEVHEWNNNQEQLVAWSKLNHVSTLIMSATMDDESLMEYYKESVNAIYVPGSQYKVEMEERPSFELLSTIKENIAAGKNILVFLPGKREIFDTLARLDGENAVLLPLHGEMDWEDQNKCFEEYGLPKVICATNVAQTSITIPDIDVVIDTGKARISDVQYGIQGLFLRDISQADIMQRAGRAGRTKDGKYILCSDKPISEREKYTKPEIERSLLERVVLQFANIGLDAGKIEFFHQPSRIELQRAKRELIKLGALDENNVVTSIGREMVILPLNAQLARMIVEAEKLGVTEDVIKIASIVEMGGLLLKNSYYSSFTNERTSDLLAELDVWNHLNSQDEIDFEGEGINKKNFFKIKEHIQAVTEAVSEYVTITSSNMRDNILKACLVGLGSHIFVRNWNGFIDNSGIRRKLDRKSCVEFFGADFLIGIPKTIEYKDRYGYLAKMELISFATAIDGRTALEVVPKSYIYEETTEEYSEVDDVVVKKVVAYILGKSARVLYIKDYCNPRYEELKKEYEEYCLRKAAYYDAGTEKHQMCQDEVTVNGTQYTVYYDGDEPYINLFSNKELMEIKAEHITLLDGTIVTVKCEGKSNKSVATLQRMVGEYITVIVRKYNRSKFNMNGVGSIGDVIRVKDYLTKLSLDGSLAGYTGISVTAYGCLKRQKDGRVILDIVDEAKIAETQTAEALKYLAMKKLKKDYVDSKFSHNTGKKKKTLTPQEETVKEDFWHLATDVVASIKVENIEESLQFVQEYYAELMS